MNPAIVLIGALALGSLAVCFRDDRLSLRHHVIFIAECLLQSCFCIAVMYNLFLWLPESEFYNFSILFLISYLVSGTRGKPSLFFLFPFAVSAAAIMFYPVMHLSGALWIVLQLWGGVFLVGVCLVGIREKLILTPLPSSLQAAALLLTSVVILQAFSLLWTRYIPAAAIFNWDIPMRAAFFWAV